MEILCELNSSGLRRKLQGAPKSLPCPCPVGRGGHQWTADVTPWRVHACMWVDSYFQTCVCLCIWRHRASPVTCDCVSTSEYCVSVYEYVQSWVGMYVYACTSLTADPSARINQFLWSPTPRSVAVPAAADVDLSTAECLELGEYELWREQEVTLSMRKGGCFVPSARGPPRPGRGRLQTFLTNRRSKNLSRAHYVPVILSFCCSACHYLCP